jgi:hypothetical protein
MGDENEETKDQNGLDVDSFFERLQKTLDDAVPADKTDEVDGKDGDQKADDEGSQELAKVVDNTVARLEALEKALTGDGDDSIRGLLTKLNEQSDNTREAMLKVIDRVEALEGATTVKKSLDGGDKDGDGEEGDVSKGGSPLAEALARSARQARTTGHSELTLT